MSSENNTLEQNQPQSGFGFVYILVNDRMPGLLKIGQTQRHPEIRAEELSGHTGVPVRYRVAFFVEVSDRLTAEKRAHGALANCRLGGDREFFESSLEGARAALCSALKDLIPVSSPFKPYLENLKRKVAVNADSPLGGESHEKRPLCTKCETPMKQDAFRVHWVCFNCGLIQ